MAEKKRISLELAKNISHIMTDFNFELVAEYMSNGSDEEVCDSEVREYAESLLWEAVENATSQNSDDYFIEGKYFLRAEYHKDEEFERCSLICQIERCDGTN